jgi:sec-independent protein translocase protein TatA
MGELRPLHLLLIIVIILILFGGSRIPELMRGLGKGIREFKDAKDGGKDDAKKTEDPGQKTDKS